MIIDVATGEVLAAASTPLPQDQKRGGRSSMASETASINRAIEAAYPPGSLVKPLVYLAAVTEGLLREDEKIECNGHFSRIAQMQRAVGFTASDISSQRTRN